MRSLWLSTTMSNPTLEWPCQAAANVLGKRSGAPATGVGATCGAAGTKRRHPAAESKNTNASLQKRGRHCCRMPRQAEPARGSVNSVRDERRVPAKPDGTRTAANHKDTGEVKAAVPLLEDGAHGPDAPSGSDPDRVPQKRRSRLEIIVDCLRRLGRNRREDVIRKLTKAQKLAVEEFLLQQSRKSNTNPRATSGGQEAKTSPKEEVTSSDSADAPPPVIGPAKTATVPAVSACATAPSTAAAELDLFMPRHSSRGIAHSIKGGIRFYYASMCFDSLILRCRATRCYEEAEEQHAALLAIQQHAMCWSERPFEARMRSAVEAVLEERKERGDLDIGLTCCVRVAATWWLGRDLLTPLRPATGLEEVLCEWRRLRLARGRPKVGGAGLLYQHPLHEIGVMWEKLRKEYLSICANLGTDVRAVASRLDKWTKAREPHRHQQTLRWETYKARRARRALQREKAEERSAARAVAIEARQLKAMHLQKQAEESREVAVLGKLEQLLSRWPTTERPRRQRESR